MRLLAAVAVAFALTALSGFGANAIASANAPYTHMPVAGESVRFDGTVGGQKSAWAYYQQHWLEEFLKITIDAASTTKAYADVRDQLDRVASHVSKVANGTKASVETVQPFDYGGRQDVEVRLLVQDGPLRGRELWTTCAELVDSAGHSFLRM